MAHKPLVLAVETSSRIGSVALALGEKMLAETTFSAPIRHSAEILPAICNLLEHFNQKPTKIEHVYISIGPGSFTGLRIAVTIAKTMHLANAVKVVPVNTLDVIAANLINLTKEKDARYLINKSQTASYERIATILDAKRGQFFIAVYEQNEKDGTFKKILQDSLITAPQFLNQFTHNKKTIGLLGDGLLYHKDKFKTDAVQFLDEKYWSPRASKVHLLGWKKALANQFADPLTLIPNYLLRPDIKTKAK
jgi:tRNA threonylcarbamoyladenosine biosynthesis protein TsaB